MVSRGALEFVDKGAALQRIFAQVLLNRVQPCRHHLTLHVTLPQVRRLQIEHYGISMSHHYSPSPHPSRHPPAGRRLLIYQTPSQHESHVVTIASRRLQPTL